MMFCTVLCSVDEGERSNVGVHAECPECNAAAYGAATSRHFTGLFTRVSEDEEQHSCSKGTGRTAWSRLP